MRAAPVVLIHGEESYLVEKELSAIEAECSLSGGEDMNRQVFDASETDSTPILNTAKTLPFLGPRRLLIVKNAGSWKNEQWERVAHYAKNPNPSTCLTLVVENPDKRRTWWKAVAKAARLVDCPHPSDADLYKWAGEMAAEAGLKLGPSVARSLVTLVGPDLMLLWREILKLEAYAGESRVLDEEDVKKLVGETRATSVFTLCDALGSKNAQLSLKTLKRLMGLGEAPIMLLYMIARHFRILWRALEYSEKKGKSPAGAAQALGLPPFVAKKALEQAGNWTDARMREVFETFLEADMALKSGGGPEVLDALVLGLCGRPAKRK